ncbi:hypothetical protein ES705_39570 [subsurface metagenome]
MATEINEWQAKEQSRKSIDSRIHRTRRGIPATCEPVEQAVFMTIFENIADVTSFERAIAESLPDERMVHDLEQKIKTGEKQLKTISRELDKLINLALSGTLTKVTIQGKEQSLIEAKTKIEETLQADRDQFHARC